VKLQNPEYGLCVPHVLHHIISYKKRNITVEDIKRDCKSHKVHGTTEEGVKQCLKKHSFKFARFKFTYRDIREICKKSTPIVATYKCSDREGHFTIITGVHTERKIEYISLMDPLYGFIVFPFSVFRVLWKLDGSWARLVVPKD